MKPHGGKQPRRTALLIRCSAEEARTIREFAKAERRTISEVVRYAVIRHIDLRRKWAGLEPVG